MLFIERTIYYNDIYFSYYKQPNIQSILYIKMNLLYNTNDINFSLLINILYYMINFITKKNLIKGYIIPINFKTKI